ncbi:MAG: S8 family serine peptidase [Verrucomicrobia bacterium]|nr:S8 family serine peptidase [Verrucomicrobiota bacterium]
MEKATLNPTICLARWVAAAAFVLSPLVQVPARSTLTPRVAPAKPLHTHLSPARDDPARIRVKFRDELPVRLLEAQVNDCGTGAVNKALPLLQWLASAGARWQRLHSLPEAKLAQLREAAQANLGRSMADLNATFVLRLPPGMNAAAVMDELNALPEIELARPMRRAMPLPTPPNLEPEQEYLEAATAGVDAPSLWTLPGGTGTGVRIADIEYDWNFNHADLSFSLIGPAPVDPFAGSADHGTAVLGVLGALRNGWGVTGIAHGSALHVVAAHTDDGLNIPAAITRALDVLTAGDVMVIEQQALGPDPDPGLVPAEWDEDVYDAIVIAVGNGVIVCEAAGNGNQNLDDAKFDDDHAPFLPQNDSGAILVGAGAPPGHPEGDRARHSFSTYGSTVDLQGWGAWVVTAGYGDRYSAEGTNLLYTANFNGTSSATPMVGGACAALQGAYKAAYGGRVLSPASLRHVLRVTGSAQQSGVQPASENIGPRPNLAAALPLALGTWLNFPYAGPEEGTLLRPFNTLPEALALVPAAGTINILPGRANWTGTISKPVTLQAYGGLVTLGR